MADLVISDVQFTSGFRSESVLLGEAVSKYDVLYKDNTTNSFKLASAATTDASAATVIALDAGVIGDYVPAAQLSTAPTVTATPGVGHGDRFLLSDTPGKITDAQTDLATGSAIIDIGTGDAALMLRFAVRPTGVFMP